MKTMSRFKRIFLPVMGVTILLTASCKSEKKIVEPHSCEDLRGLTVSVMEGSVQADYANEHLQGMDIKFVYFPGHTDGMMAVVQGKADVNFSNDLQIYNDEFRKMNLKVCHLLGEIQAPFGFGVKKGNDEVLSGLNAVISELQTEGTLQELTGRWFNEKNTDFHDCIVIPPAPSTPDDTKPVIKVGISGIKLPAEVMIDNRWTGFEIEILQRYAQSVGCNLEILTFDFHNLIPALQSGTVDVIAATLIINEERKEKIDFSISTHEMKTAFIVKGKNDDGKSAWDRIKESAYSSLVKENRWKLITSGLGTTLIITLLSLLFGSILGGVICGMRMSRRSFPRKFAEVYLYIMRNIPMLVFLMLMFYVFLAQTGLDPVTVAIIAFSMNSAAFISEIFRTGIQSIDNGQVEAGRGIGCSAFQTFVYIVAPQAIKKIIPVFKNECVSLLKSTSIVGYIAIIDLTKGSDLIRSSSFEAFFPLIVITIIYFILATLITVALDRVMRKI